MVVILSQWPIMAFGFIALVISGSGSLMCAPIQQLPWLCTSPLRLAPSSDTLKSRPLTGMAVPQQQHVFITLTHGSFSYGLPLFCLHNFQLGQSLWISVGLVSSSWHGEGISKGDPPYSRDPQSASSRGWYLPHLKGTATLCIYGNP